MSEMNSLTKKNHLEKRDRIAVKNCLEGEMMCKYWTCSGKLAKPRDMIYVLRTELPKEQAPSGEQYEKCSKKMANLARNYHDNLQYQVQDVSEVLREEKIAKVLSNIKTRTSPQQNSKLRASIAKTEISKALKKAKNSSAPGLDDIPYEFWKSINDQFVYDSRLNIRGDAQKPSFDVLELLNRVFINIQEHGLMENSPFAEG